MCVCVCVCMCVCIVLCVTVVRELFLGQKGTYTPAHVDQFAAGATSKNLNVYIRTNYDKLNCFVRVNLYVWVRVCAVSVLMGTKLVWICPNDKQAMEYMKKCFTNCFLTANIESNNNIDVECMEQLNIRWLLLHNGNQCMHWYHCPAHNPYLGCLFFCMCALWQVRLCGSLADGVMPWRIWQTPLHMEQGWCSQNFYWTVSNTAFPSWNLPNAMLTITITIMSALVIIRITLRTKTTTASASERNNLHQHITTTK